MSCIFMPLPGKEMPRKRLLKTYIVEEGDTFAGIALRHNMRESELRAMNNLLGGTIFPGQVLKVYHKKRSHSMPTLPMTKAMSRAEEEEEEENETLNQPEASPIEDEPPQHCQVEFKKSQSRPEDNDEEQLKSQMVPHWKKRSQSARLPTHEEEEELVLPKLIGGTASELLSDARFSMILVPKLEACLPTRFRGYDWKLLYSLPQHGSSLHTLLRMVRGKSPTLIVVETTRGDVFGGFVAVPWQSSTSYYGIGESFVFTCQPRFEHFPWSRKNTMFMLSNDRSIAMGGGGSFAWYLNSDLSQGACGESDTFKNRRLTTEPDFIVACVEVWGFVTKR